MTLKMKRKCKMLGVLAALLILAAALPVLAEPAQEGVLAGTAFDEISKDGFHIPLPKEQDWQGGEAWGMRGLFAESIRKGAGSELLTLQAYSQELDQFVQTAEDANRYYDSLHFENEQDVQISSVNIEGHAARLVTFSYMRQENSVYSGILLYAREMRMLQLRLYSETAQGTEQSAPRVTMEDLLALAGRIHFAAEEAPIRHSDVELTIGVAGDIPVVSAGGTLQLLACFGNDQIVNAAKGNNEVIWEALDPGTGLASDVAEINAKGLLTAGKNVQWASEVVVRVTSAAYETVSTRKILITPPATALIAEPDTVTFYAGENRTETIVTRIEPDIVPLIGLSWNVNKKDLLEITDNGNGTATVRPLMAGRGTLTIREPSGKGASVKVVVLQPVLELELTQKGKPRPGNIVVFTVKLNPYNAGDRTVEWSVDVDESIATITNRGRLRINKEAPAGSVIHVTCTAVGAPEPVTATAEVVVEEK